jgi:hypothetical protein
MLGINGRMSDSIAHGQGGSRGRTLRGFTPAPLTPNGRAA